MKTELEILTRKIEVTQENLNHETAIRGHQVADLNDRVDHLMSVLRDLIQALDEEDGDEQ